ncbi:sulfurtransferase complex subunit TusD [Gilliamella sp. ESL0250]|uniref:sulfurtransferase complex subunit TusD n=1 Tax=Gilliamella sp. ESL0250 TaxID=2705036 RepID=UPI00158091A0|nr:sulfurtransferase complex subunit TusD [Gilliamella sp. ESL0250]NUF49013.1 sulfurtransferase complex subunit TusD [Gilliamella sp. ESL0250]
MTILKNQHQLKIKNTQLNNLLDSLSYTLVVMGPAYGTQSAYCAYQFAQVLLSNTPHTIKNIFFYADGVYNGNRYTDPASDEFDLISAWQELSQKHAFTLTVCVAAAQRRGIIENNLADHFQLTGLGELSESIAMTDRTIQF